MTKLNKIILNKSYFAELLLVWTLLNCTILFKVNPYCQYVAILFAIWGGAIIINDLLSNKRKFIDSKILLIFLLLISSSLFSCVYAFAFQGSSGIVQNVYSIVAISINLLILCYNDFSKKTIKNLLLIGIIISSIFVIISLLSLFGIWNFELTNESGKYFTFGLIKNEFRLAGISGNPNDLARLCLFSGVNIVLYLFYFNPKRNIIMYLLLLADWIVIVFTGCRGVIVSVYISLTLYFVKECYLFVIHENGLQCKRNMLIVLLVLVLMVISGYSHNIYSNHYLNEYNKTQVNAESNDKNGIVDQSSNQNIVNNSEITVDSNVREKSLSSGRSFLIKLGLNATVYTSPIFGLTPGFARRDCIAYLHDVMQTTEVESSAVGNTHNTFIQAYVNYGVMFVTLIFVLVILVVKKIVTNIFSKKNSILFICIFSILSISMVENVFLYSYENEPLNILLMILLGYLLFNGQEIESIQEENNESFA